MAILDNYLRKDLYQSSFGDLSLIYFSIPGSPLFLPYIEDCVAYRGRYCYTRLLTKQVVVGILLILPRQPTIADMVEVLEPLKVRYSHTSSIGKEIGDNQNPAVMEDPLSSYGCWTIGTFSNNLAFIFTTVKSTS